MKIALLGLPQSGKKTLFKLLTGRDVPLSRKPAETVDGVARIRDPRVDALAQICKPERTVYAENHFVLCPDVVKDSPHREWLEAARKCDLLCILVRAFESAEVYHPAGSVDAARDRAMLEAELVFADLELVDKRLQRIAREKKGGQTPQQAQEEHVLHKCMAVLEGGKPLTQAGLDEHELAPVSSLSLVTLIPVLWAHNVSEEEVGRPHADGCFAISCRIEQEIMDIEDDGERGEYLASLGLRQSGVDRVNAAAYDALGLMSFYTVGADEVRAWTIRKGSHAPTAGGKVHTDIERGFIRAEVIKFDDFVAAGSEHAARSQGRMQTRGKDYVIEDGDICHFLFNV